MLFIIAALIQGGDYCFTQPATADSSRFPLNEPKHPVILSCVPSGALFVLDQGSNEITKYSPGGSVLAHTGGFGGGDDGFDSPSDINALSDLQLLVSDYGNNRILVYDGRLTRTETIGADLSGTGEKVFGYPRSVAADRYGAMYVVDGENTRVVKIDANRKFERAIGGPEAGKGKLTNPTRVRVSEDDHVYVLDGRSVKTYDVFGNYLQSVTVADTGKVLFTLILGTPFVSTGDSLRSIGGDLVLPLPRAVGSETARDISASGDWVMSLTDSTVGKIRLPGVIGEKDNRPADH